MKCLFCSSAKKLKLRAENMPVCQSCWDSMVTRCNAIAGQDYRNGGRCMQNTIDPSGLCWQHLQAGVASYNWRTCGKEYKDRFSGKILKCNGDYNIDLDHCDYCTYRDKNPN